jgi:hypothetical protein
MHFKIDATCKRGLRIISEIPDFEVSRIEGYNGIGKSSALRLLALCTGEQPYHGKSGLWASFRGQLVHASVSVTGLQGEASRITWDLTPSAWPDTPEPLGEGLGQVRIDGRHARSADVASLLRVHRVLASETFIDNLTERLEAAARRLDAWTAYGTGAIWRRVEDLESLLDVSRKAIQAPEGSELRKLRLDLAIAEEQSRQAAREVERIGARVGQLSEARDLAEQLSDIRGREPELSAQLTDIHRQQEELQQERSALDERITEVGRRESKDAAARKEFELARQNLDRRERDLRAARSRLSAAASAAGSGSDLIQVEAVEQTLSSKLDDLTDRLPKVSASPFMASLLAEIADRLRQAEESGLGGEVLIPGLPADSEWTVTDWRNASEREAAKRAAEGATDTAQALEAEIMQVRRRLQLLAAVRDAHDSARQAAVLKDRAGRRLEQAIEKLPSDEATALDQLVTARENAEALLADLAERLAVVQHALNLVGGGKDERTLRQQLARICDEVGVPESRIRSQLTAEQEQHAVAQEASIGSRLGEESARRKIEEAASAVGAARSALETRTDLAFARRVIGELPQDSEGQAQRLSTLSSAMERASQQARGAAYQVDGIVGALNSVVRLIRGAGEPASGAAWIRPVQEWLASEVSEWFNQVDVRQALFPDGHDITVNVGEMSVSWSAGGERQVRPLEAFSSGEQALAYTRSGMAALDSSAASTANRLIALDEFGSFIDARAMQRLYGYLLDRHEAFPRDQVIVVLPLRQEMRGKPDPGDTVATSRWNQLQERGYLAERITHALS